jgi:hypothetical protein
MLTGFSVENPKAKTDESSLKTKPAKDVKNAELVRKYSSILEFTLFKEAKVNLVWSRFSREKVSKWCYI